MLPAGAVLKLEQARQFWVFPPPNGEFQDAVVRTNPQLHIGSGSQPHPSMLIDQILGTILIDFLISSSVL